VPCRDERDRLDDCITALLHAADHVPRPTTIAIVVACDSTTDGSDRIVHRWSETDPRVTGIDGAWGGAGGARRAACAAGWAQVASLGHRASTTWIASTDADTLVPPDWLTSQLSYAWQGFEAVAGIVDLRDDEPLDGAVATAFAGHYPVGRSTHRHVHGANLGVRADAYLAAGGFPPLDVSEDHALWTALHDAGRRCVSSVSVRVATSGRLVGRATGGFADTVARLAGAGSQPA
jgi:cellulose synthase/poly-beta-1,6-N-acetylglucosamine synthase-like glycosyltransferase